MLLISPGQHHRTEYSSACADNHSAGGGRGVGARRDLCPQSDAPRQRIAFNRDAAFDRRRDDHDPQPRHWRCRNAGHLENFAHIGDRHDAPHVHVIDYHLQRVRVADEDGQPGEGHDLCLCQPGDRHDPRFGAGKRAAYAAQADRRRDYYQGVILITAYGSRKVMLRHRDNSRRRGGLEPPYPSLNENVKSLSLGKG